MTFAEALKTARKREGFSLKETARRVGSSFTTIQYYESGKLSPRLKIALKLARLFHFSLDSLNENEVRGKRYFKAPDNAVLPKGILYAQD